MGWLRVLSEWVGAAGSVTGSDIDEKMLAHANAFVAAESLGNVTLLKDDIFASVIPSNSFDLVHIHTCGCLCSLPHRFVRALEALIGASELAELLGQKTN